MSVVALIGDCTTTTSLALAAGAPADRQAILIEADRSGGSLAAWLGTPSSPTLSAIVAALSAGSRDAGWGAIEPHVRSSPSGTRFIAAPVRSLEANRAIAEAGTTVFPLLARLAGPTLVADLGRHLASAPPPVLAGLADTIVVCHRQRGAAATAAGVRLERCAELVESLATAGAPTALAVIGDRPFDLAEIADFVSAESGVDVAAHQLVDDPLAADVLAGRAGVSARRLARLPLMRSAATLAERVFAARDAHAAEISAVDAVGDPAPEAPAGTGALT